MLGDAIASDVKLPNRQTSCALFALVTLEARSIERGLPRLGEERA